MSTTYPTRPQVGVGLLVVRGADTLLARRKGPYGAGEYSTPGGHLELGESFEEGALRELREECGPDIVVTAPRFLCLTNLRKYAPRHYAAVSLVSHWIEGEPLHMEPGSVEEWRWHPMDRLPDRRFAATDNVISAYRTGQPYFTR
jgi:8-oxo-dGTP diphosphatase